MCHDLVRGQSVAKNDSSFRSPSSLLFLKKSLFSYVFGKRLLRSETRVLAVASFHIVVSTPELSIVYVC